MLLCCTKFLKSSVCFTFPFGPALTPKCSSVNTWPAATNYHRGQHSTEPFLPSSLQWETLIWGWIHFSVFLE